MWKNSKTCCKIPNDMSEKCISLTNINFWSKKSKKNDDFLTFSKGYPLWFLCSGRSKSRFYRQKVWKSSFFTNLSMLGGKWKNVIFDKNFDRFWSLDLIKKTSVWRSLVNFAMPLSQHTYIPYVFKINWSLYEKIGFLVCEKIVKLAVKSLTIWAKNAFP